MIFASDILGTFVSNLFGRAGAVFLVGVCVRNAPYGKG